MGDGGWLGSSLVEEKEEIKGCFDAADAFKITEGGAGAVQDPAVLNVSDGGTTAIHHSAIFQVANGGATAVHHSSVFEITNGRS